ncbi:MAG: DUF3147 family protein [Vampirovibrionales bacterium]|nr:DUF3147 family protein [Vampirovibrionales bacterium]
MIFFCFKVALSALLLSAVSTLAKHNTFWAGLLASLPMVSILSIIWLFAETQDNEKIVRLCYTIVWMVLPSLSLFLILPVLLRQNWAFLWALITACLLTAGCYYIFCWGCTRLGWFESL